MFFFGYSSFFQVYLTALRCEYVCVCVYMVLCVLFRCDVTPHFTQYFWDRLHIYYDLDQDKVLTENNWMTVANKYTKNSLDQIIWIHHLQNYWLLQKTYAIICNSKFKSESVNFTDTESKMLWLKTKTYECPSIHPTNHQAIHPFCMLLIHCGSWSWS